jgi:ATPase subunit of ABC transporter with duplicated ATPase domains
MLSVSNLTVKNAVFDNEIIKDLSFTVNNGDKIAVIGSEGMGKSTLLKLISGKVLDYVSYQGEIVLSSKVYYLEQNISYLWNLKTVYDYLFSDSLFLNEMLADAKVFFAGINLDYNDLIDRRIETLSGGEKVKIALIKAMINKPDILLLDEPSNDLDFETIVFLEEFLINLEKGVIFISHDQRLLENVANGIVHLQHVHKQMKAKSYFYRSGYLEYKNRYFRKISSDSQIARRQRTDYQEKMKKFRQIYQKVEYQQNQAVRDPELARLLKKKIHSLKSQEKRFEKEKKNWVEIPEVEESMNVFFDEFKRVNPNKIILNIDIDNFGLKNGKIIENISLVMKANEKTVIYGRNGVGKTTLIQRIIDILKEKNISYGYIPQNYLEILVKEETVVSYLLKRQDKYLEFRLRQILGQVGFKREEMDKSIEHISEGQKLKVLLLLIVCKDADIIILDEPTRNISPINQDEIYDLFLSFQGAVLGITHDREFIETVFDNIYELCNYGLFKR